MARGGVEWENLGIEWKQRVPVTKGTAYEQKCPRLRAGACGQPRRAVILTCHRIVSHEAQPRNPRGHRRRTRGPGGSPVPGPVSTLSRPDRVYRDAELPAQDVLRSHALLHVPVDLFSAPPDLASVYRPGNRHAG